MLDFDFDLVEPPYYQLDEAIDWIELTQVFDAERDWSRSESISRLEKPALDQVVDQRLDHGQP